MTALLSNLHTLKATQAYLLSEHREKKLFGVGNSFSFFFQAYGEVPVDYNTRVMSKSWKVDFWNTINIFTKLDKTSLKPKREQLSITTIFIFLKKM